MDAARLGIWRWHYSDGSMRIGAERLLLLPRIELEGGAADWPDAGVVIHRHRHAGHERT
ncbi:hypothetical protein D3C86_2121470 [compost metagenome]